MNLLTIPTPSTKNSLTILGIEIDDSLCEQANGGESTSTPTPPTPPTLPSINDILSNLFNYSSYTAKINAYVSSILAVPWPLS